MAADPILPVKQKKSPIEEHQENSPFLSKGDNLSWHSPAVPTLTFCLECALGIQFSYNGGKVQNSGPTDSKTPAPDHDFPQTERKENTSSKQ